MKFQMNYWIILAGLLVMVGIVQFFSGMLQATACYGAGEDSYSWTRHFISDLGRLETDEGSENRACAAIFTRTVVVTGICLLPFFAIAHLYIERLGVFISVCGVLSSLGLIGIGLTPYDQYFVLHNAALALWMGPMLLAMLALWMGRLAEERRSLLLTIITLAVIAACVLYVLGLSNEGHRIFQKGLVACAMLWFVYVIGLLSFSIVVTVSPRHLLAEEQAVEYMQDLQRGHRQFRPRDADR